MLSMGPQAVVLKSRIERGARIHLTSGEVIEAPGFPVEIYNILGAGDAFGGGFLYGYVNGWGWCKSARLGQCLRRDCRHQTRLRQFHANTCGSREFVSAYGGLE